MTTEKKNSGPQGKLGGKSTGDEATEEDDDCHHSSWRGAFVHRIINCDAHHRLFIAIAVALIVAFITPATLQVPTRIVLTWDAFTFSVLLLAWIRMATADPLRCVRTAKLQDSNRTLISLFNVGAACVSLFAVAYLLGTAKGSGKDSLVGHVLLSGLTVAGSWLLIHTMFALSYAHVFYGDSNDPEIKSYAGGMDFPGNKNPDYLDFSYFSFVIGMTCQVSDVQITDRGLRLTALVHGLLSFAFNTFIVALSINMISGLISN